jgi:uncharacterized zinc-type alcohol dehydrogenase-like protein
MFVRAYAATVPGGPFEPLEYDAGPIGPTEVGIDVICCGLCHSDLHMLDNDWEMTVYPFVAGHEVIGVVRDVGSQVKYLRPGQRVGVGWQCGSCGGCPSCRSGQEQLCAEAQGTCVQRHGGFASYVRSDERFVIPIPESMRAESAGPLLCGGITVFSPLVQYDVRPTMSVGIVGIGGLGHLAVQFADAFGCDVYAFSSSPDKEEEALELGADHFVSSRDQDSLMALAGSLDFILSTVFAELPWDTYVSMLRPNGTLCLVASPAENLSIGAFPLIVGQRRITGSVIGPPQLQRTMLDFAARHEVQPQTEVMAMSRINDAFQKLRRNEARYRIVLTNEGG